MIVSPSRILWFCDCWNYRKIKQTLQFLQELANVHICRRFWASTRPLTSSQSAFSQRKVVYQFKKLNEHLWILIMPDLQRATLDKLTESGTNLCYSFDLLGLEPRAALDHATPLYSALGDTVKKEVEFSAESITSQSDHVRRIQIWWRILLKLRISEQTPLMWKPGETLSKQLHHSPWI